MMFSPLKRSRVHALTALSRATRSSFVAVGLAGVFAAQASAAGAPIVSVPTAPTWFSAGSYKLSATVNPNGAATISNIQYGPTISYGKQFVGESIPVGAPKDYVRATVAQPIGSTVHYRIRALNSYGETFGPDQTFVVGTAPTVTAGGRPQATMSAARSFYLRGTVNANSINTTTRIEYGPTTSYGTSVASSPVSGSAATEVRITVANPTPGSVINYRTVATNAAGTVTGPNQTFTVPRGVVRPVYMYPTDRSLRLDYYNAIKSALTSVQSFYAGQLGGKTFTIASQPLLCPLEHDSAYYGSETQNANGSWTGAWSKLDAALTACGATRDTYTDNVVYADIHSISCNDRIGAGTTRLTFMGDTDLQGLTGQTGFTNAPCGTGVDQRTGPWGYTGGLGHELGHTLGLPHPDLSNCGTQAQCDYAYNSLMYIGYFNLNTTYFLQADKNTLNASDFISS